MLLGENFMKGVAYIRVSTKEQDEEIQRGAIEDFAKQKGIEIVEWYIDKGESGAKLFIERPNAQKLLKDLENNKVDAIISWSLDRLGRTMLDTLNTVMELEKKGYKVITIKEEFLQTLDSDIRKLILSILSWVAEFERRRMQERREEAWKQGKQKGRPEIISTKELEKYLRKYPDLSLRALTKVINADREAKAKPPVSYFTIFRKVKMLGYKKLLSKKSKEDDTQVSK
jgi:DNA invertase Pin-like site-specific DNA recombinase